MPPGEVLLGVRGLSAIGAFSDVSFDLHPARCWDSSGCRARAPARYCARWPANARVRGGVLPRRRT